MTAAHQKQQEQQSERHPRAAILAICSTSEYFTPNYVAVIKIRKIVAFCFYSTGATALDLTQGFSRVPIVTAETAFFLSVVSSRIGRSTTARNRFICSVRKRGSHAHWRTAALFPRPRVGHRLIVVYRRLVITLHRATMIIYVCQLSLLSMLPGDPYFRNRPTLLIYLPKQLA